MIAAISPGFSASFSRTSAARTVPSVARRHGDDGIAEERGGRRIGAVRRFRHQHLRARLAARGERRLDRHHAAELAMRAGLRRHRDGMHAGDFEQPAAELVDQLQRAGHGGGRLQRMDVGKAGQPRHLLVEARIVLHRARAERIDAHVDGVVLLAEPHVVAHRLRLGEAGKVDRRFAAMLSEAVAFRCGHVDVDAGDLRAADLEEQRLLDGEPAIAGEGFVLRPRSARRGWGGPGRSCESLRKSGAATSPLPLAGRGLGEGWLTMRVAAERTPASPAPPRKGEGSSVARGAGLTALPPSASANASISASVTVSVAATTRRFARSGCPGTSRETGTPAMMPLRRQRLDDRRGGLRQLHRELVEERLVQHLDARHFRERIGELAGAGVVRLGELPQPRLAEQRHVRGEGEASRGRNWCRCWRSPSRGGCAARGSRASARSRACPPRRPSCRRAGPASGG